MRTLITTLLLIVFCKLFGHSKLEKLNSFQEYCSRCGEVFTDEEEFERWLNNMEAAE